MNKRIALFMGVACVLGAIDPAMGSRPRNPPLSQRERESQYFQNISQLVIDCRHLGQESVQIAVLTADEGEQKAIENLISIIFDPSNPDPAQALYSYIKAHDCIQALQILTGVLLDNRATTLDPSWFSRNEPTVPSGQTTLLPAPSRPNIETPSKTSKNFLKELGTSLLTSVFTRSPNNPGDSNSTPKKQITIRREVDCRFVRCAYDLYNDKTKALSNLNGLDRAAGDPAQMIKFLTFGMENPEVLTNMDGLLNNALLRGILEGFLSSKKATNPEKAMEFLALLANHPNIIQNIDGLSANHPIINLAVSSFLVNPGNQAIFEQWLLEQPEKKAEILETILDSGVIEDLLDTQLRPTVELLFAE